MTDRPILFNAEMVRAILADKKTQTRKVIKPQPRWCEMTQQWLWWADKDTLLSWQDGVIHPEMLAASPYQVGMNLWVRETFAMRSDIDGKIDPDRARHYMYYRADSTPFDPADIHNWHDYGGRWRPSIFMPRWASRITLEVMGVRVERVQDITLEDMIAEGVTPIQEDCYFFDSYAIPFCKLWDSINAKRGYSWEQNPWIWVVEFKLEQAR